MTQMMQGLASVTNDLEFILRQWKVSVQVVQLCPTLCNPMDCSLPVSFVHGISQTRILELVAIPSPGHLPSPGIEPLSPALVGRLFTTEPPGKPLDLGR